MVFKDMSEEIIKEAPERMQEMLRSVYAFNKGVGSGRLLKHILKAMGVIDRKIFTYFKNPYEDNAIPIGRDQTISQPSTVARMLLLADLKEGDKVLEIGAGSGWNAALMAFLVYPGDVISVDRIKELVELCNRNISDLKQSTEDEGVIARLENLYFLQDDIFTERGLWGKSFDKIIFTAGIPDKKTEKKIKEIAEELLEEDGILICPYVSGPLVIYRKKKKITREETKEQYVFVPLLEGIEE